MDRADEDNDRQKKVRKLARKLRKSPALLAQFRARRAEALLKAQGQPVIVSLSSLER